MKPCAPIRCRGPAAGALLLVSLLLPVGGCNQLEPVEPSVASLPLLPRGGALYLSATAVNQLARRGLAESAQLRTLQVRLEEGFTHRDGVGTILYGPEEWSLPLKLSEFEVRSGRIHLVFDASATETAMTLILYPRYGWVRRCTAALAWSASRLTFDLLPSPAVDGTFSFATRAFVASVALPERTFEGECGALIPPEVQEELATRAREAFQAAFARHAEQYAAKLAGVLGFSLSIRGVAATGPPADGRLAVLLQVAEDAKLEPALLHELAPTGLLLPLRVGLAQEADGRCCPGGGLEPAAPEQAPLFLVGEEEQRVQERGPIFLALSSQLLSRLVANLAETGFVCQPVRGKSGNPLRVRDLSRWLAFPTDVPFEAPLTIQFRLGEPPAVLLDEVGQALRIELRRLALDLYVQLDGAELRVLGALADVRLPLRLTTAANGIRPLVEIAMEGPEVTPHWTTSELLVRRDNAAVLKEVYQLGLAALLAERFELAAIELGGHPLRPVRSVIRGSYLQLVFQP